MKINNNHTQAQVISTYSRRMKIRTNDGKISLAKILGKQLKPVCGDIVIIKKEERMFFKNEIFSIKKIK